MKKEFNEYDKQAEDFLEKHNLVIEAIEAVPQVSPRWAIDGKHGVQWSITISKIEKEERADRDIAGMKFFHPKVIESIQFFFWTSVFEKERWQEKNQNAMHQSKHPKPTPYQILASLWNEVDGGFEDFCANYGYDTDSRNAEATYKECIELNNKLSKVLTPKAIEDLKEII